MNINEAFPGTYLKAADLQGRRIPVVIERIVVEEIGGDHKPIVYFRGKDRGLVLNKTNANTIAEAFGQETDQWVGATITLFEARVEFQGKRVPAIRVDIPPTLPVKAAPQPAEPNPPADNFVDDEIPF